MTSRQASSTVMVIEPEVLLRTETSDYLRECGHRVIEAVRGADVWIALKSGTRLDVVFAEVKLPGELQGFGLAHALRQEYPGIDVILTSGETDAVDEANGVCAGFVGKPYELTDVGARIRALLGRRRDST